MNTSATEMTANDRILFNFAIIELDRIAKLCFSMQTAEIEKLEAKIAKFAKFEEATS